MPVSKNNKKNRSHRVWKKKRNVKNKSPRNDNDWIKSTKRTCKGFCNYGMLGKRFADYE